MSTQTNPPNYPNNPSFEPQSEYPARPRPRMPRLTEQQIPEFLQRRTDNYVAPEQVVHADYAQPGSHDAYAPQEAYAPHDAYAPVLDNHPIAAEAPGLSPVELEELEREITRPQPQQQPQLRPRRSLAPEFMPPPPLRSKAKVAGDGMTALVFRLCFVSALVVFFVLLYLGKVPLPASWKSAAAEPWKRLAAIVHPTTPPATTPTLLPPSIPPKLIVEGADAGNNDEIGLGVRLVGRIEGVTALVSGLVPGSKLSRGHAWNNNEWIVPASALAETKLRPPADFNGTMQYTIAVKTPDGKVADQQTLRLQWSPAKREPERKIDPDEISAMITRGEKLFENGDIASARLLLQRAAEAGDQTAAMALAATYDPSVMTDLGVRGVKADVEKARFWYEKAREYGSKEAPKRLESLASQSR